MNTESSFLLHSSHMAMANDTVQKSSNSDSMPLRDSANNIIPIPSSMNSIVPILRAANVIQQDHTRVAYLCRWYALLKADEIDPKNISPGAMQFKTRLMRRLERENNSIKLERDVELFIRDAIKESDVLEIDNYFKEYYRKIEALEAEEEHKEKRGKLENSCQTAKVLYDVLLGVHKKACERIFDIDDLEFDDTSEEEEDPFDDLEFEFPEPKREEIPSEASSRISPLTRERDDAVHQKQQRFREFDMMKIFSAMLVIAAILMYVVFKL